MPATEKKGITVKIDADLHAEIRDYLEKHEMTMGDFITMAADNELHPKFNYEKENKNMENTRTMAFQVPETLFQRIKDYLARNHMTQKQFVLGLIEEELDRDEALYQKNDENSPEEAEEDEEADLDEDDSEQEEEDDVDDFEEEEEDEDEEEGLEQSM